MEIVKLLIRRVLYSECYAMSDRNHDAVRQPKPRKHDVRSRCITSLSQWMNHEWCEGAFSQDNKSLKKKHKFDEYDSICSNMSHSELQSRLK